MRHILIAIVAMAVATLCQARIITVDDNSPADFTTIQSAINDANDGDTIIVQPGRYSGNGNRDIRFLGKAITVQSIDPYDPNIISATTIVCGGSSTQPHRGFIFDSNEGPNSVLAGLTVTGGYSAPNQPLVYGPIEKYSGGGIFCKNSSPTITHCRITGNTVDGSNASGGGIFYWGGRPTISQCIITNNNSNGYNDWSSESVGGGGIYGNGEGTIIDCIIANNNTYGVGGGISCSQSTVINCTVANNSANDSGGGISCSQSTVINCTIINNSASEGFQNVGGGGIDCFNSKILNCIIEENKVIGGELVIAGIPEPQSNAYGGGITCYGNFVIDNCIIRKNSATGGGMRKTSNNLTEQAHIARGGGIYASSNSSTAAIEITRCVISENLSEGGVGKWTSGVLTGMGPGGDGLGGGIYCNDPCGTISIINCLVVANKSKGGRGNKGYVLVPPNGRIDYNYPDGNAFGGGAYCGDVTFKACTFVANEATKGAGIYGSSNVNSCILRDVNEQNSPPVSEVSGGAIVQYSDVKNGYTGEGNIDTDPCFVKLGYWIEVNTPWPPIPNPPFPPFPPPKIKLVWIEGDYRLLSDSPCIDSGDPNYIAGPNETDLDENRRVVAGRIDMGAYEFPNNLPVADAGPNQVAYAWIDGIAEVTLDANNSYDADGDELTYLWKWSIDGNDYETNGVNPTIELPVGQYTFELVVNDGREDSEPNQVVITVIEPIKSTLWVTPRVINGRSQQPNIVAMLKLPAGISKKQIDAGRKLLLYPGEIEANYQVTLRHYENSVERVVIFACFDKSALMDAIGKAGRVQLDVVGQLKTGQYFYGSDNVWIINLPPRKPNGGGWGRFDNGNRNYYDPHRR